MPKESIPRSKSGRIMDYLANRSNIGKPFRSIKALIDDPPSLTGPIRKEDIERSFDAAGTASGGSMAFRRPRNSVGTGARPYKVKDAEPARPPTGGRRPKEGEKRFVGPSRPPKEGDKKFIGPSRPPRSGDKDFIGPTRPPKAGDKDFIGPVPKSGGSSGPKTRGMSRAYKTGAAGVAAGALGYAGYKSSPDKGAAQDSAPGKTDKGAVKRREGGGGGTQSASGKQSFKDKMQGRNWKKDGESKAPKPKDKPARAASDKSSQSGKMSSFQRVRARQLEKEGYAGRSMTREAAKKKAMEKTGGLRSLFRSK